MALTPAQRNRLLWAYRGANLPDLNVGLQTSASPEWAQRGSSVRQQEEKRAQLLAKAVKSGQIKPTQLSGQDLTLVGPKLKSTEFKGGALSDVGDFFGNAGYDLWSALKGIPGGVVKTAGAFGDSALNAIPMAANARTEEQRKKGIFNEVIKPIGNQYAYTYGGKGAPEGSNFFDRFVEHPLGPILDVATVASLGAAGTIRGAQGLSMAGRGGDFTARLGGSLRTQGRSPVTLNPGQQARAGVDWPQVPRLYSARPLRKGGQKIWDYMGTKMQPLDTFTTNRTVKRLQRQSHATGLAASSAAVRAAIKPLVGSRKDLTQDEATALDYALRGWNTPEKIQASRQMFTDALEGRLPEGFNTKDFEGMFKTPNDAWAFVSYKAALPPSVEKLILNPTERMINAAQVTREAAEEGFGKLELTFDEMTRRVNESQQILDDYMKGTLGRKPGEEPPPPDLGEPARPEGPQPPPPTGADWTAQRSADAHALFGKRWDDLTDEQKSIIYEQENQYAPEDMEFGTNKPSPEETMDILNAFRDDPDKFLQPNADALANMADRLDMDDEEMAARTGGWDDSELSEIEPELTEQAFMDALRTMMKWDAKGQFKDENSLRQAFAEKYKMNVEGYLRNVDESGTLFGGSFKAEDSLSGSFFDRLVDEGDMDEIPPRTPKDEEMDRRAMENLDNAAMDAFGAKYEELTPDEQAVVRDELWKRPIPPVVPDTPEGLQSIWDQYKPPDSPDDVPNIPDNPEDLFDFWNMADDLGERAPDAEGLGDEFDGLEEDPGDEGYKAWQEEKNLEDQARAPDGIEGKPWGQVTGDDLRGMAIISGPNVDEMDFAMVRELEQRGLLQPGGPPGISMVDSHHGDDGFSTYVFVQYNDSGTPTAVGEVSVIPRNGDEGWENPGHIGDYQEFSLSPDGDLDSLAQGIVDHFGGIRPDIIPDNPGDFTPQDFMSQVPEEFWNIKGGSPEYREMFDQLDPDIQAYLAGMNMAPDDFGELSDTEFNHLTGGQFTEQAGEGEDYGWFGEMGPEEMYNTLDADWSDQMTGGPIPPKPPPPVPPTGFEFGAPGNYPIEPTYIPNMPAAGFMQQRPGWFARRMGSPDEVFTRGKRDRTLSGTGITAQNLFADPTQQFLRERPEVLASGAARIDPKAFVESVAKRERDLIGQSFSRDVMTQLAAKDATGELLRFNNQEEVLKRLGNDWVLVHDEFPMRWFHTETNVLEQTVRRMEELRQQGMSIEHPDVEVLLNEIADVNAQAFVREAFNAQKLDGVAIPRDYFNYQKRLVQATDPFDHPVGRVYSRYMHRWRALTLAYMPRWALNTAIGSFVLNMVKGVTPRDYLTARRMHKEGVFGQPRLGGVELGNITGMEYLEPGMLGHLERNTGVGITPMGERIVEAVQRIEDHFRRASFIHSLDKVTQQRMQNIGQVLTNLERKRYSIYENYAIHPKTDDGLIEQVLDDPNLVQEAIDDLNNFAYNYAALGPYERRYVRMAIPFWGWYKFISKVVYRLPAEYPGRSNFLYTLGMLGMGHEDQQLGNRPEWLKGILPIGDDQSPLKYFSTLGWNPFGQVINPFSEQGAVEGTVTLGQASPPIQALLSAFGLDPMRGGVVPISPEQGVAPDYFGSLIDIEKGRETNPAQQAGLRRLIMGLLRAAPQFRMGEQKLAGGRPVYPESIPFLDERAMPAEPKDTSMLNLLGQVLGIAPKTYDLKGYKKSIKKRVKYAESRNKTSKKRIKKETR